MSGEEPVGVEPPRPRLEAVRFVDMNGSNSWAVFAATHRQTRQRTRSMKAPRPTSKTRSGGRQGSRRTRAAGQALQIGGDQLRAHGGHRCTGPVKASVPMRPRWPRSRASSPTPSEARTVEAAYQSLLQTSCSHPAPESKQAPSPLAHPGERNLPDGDEETRPLVKTQMVRSM